MTADMKPDMKLTLVRDVVTPEFTLGVLYVDGKFFGYTCEDPVREVKIKEDTCIWYGTYEVKFTWSPKYNCEVPEVMHVREFRGIRIHPGNDKKDTEGCILPGLKRNVYNGTIADSKSACAWLYEKIKTHNTTIDIVKVTPEGFEEVP